MPLDMTPKAQIRQPDVKHITTGEIDPAQNAESFLEEIAKYNQLGKALRKESLKEIGQRLAKIAELAEVAVTNEAADWFDAHTLKRNMKEVKTYAGDFLKLAEEADTINQRMSALYDDMGRILERYFEIPDDLEPADEHPNRPDVMGQDDTLNQHTVQETAENETMSRYNKMLKTPKDLEPATKSAKDNSSVAGVTKFDPPGDEAPEPLDEAGPPLSGRDPRVFNATPLPPVSSDPKKVDALTLRAIKAVHTRLKAKNPNMANKFAQLSPTKMKEVVWELATKV
jgi:hypothetical protein